MAGRRADLIVSGLVILVLAAVSIGPLLAPQPPRETTPEQFSVDRSLEHVANIAREPHPIGSNANTRVRAYLIEELAALGLDPRKQSMTVPDYFGAPGNTVEVVNVMARMPGTDSTKAVALVAHFDSDPTTPGANDDAAGVAAILETARTLLSGPPLRNDVILLFTDGEEPAPRFGSRAFVSAHPWAAEVGFVVNLEAVGGSGPSMVIETNGPDQWIIDGLVGPAARPVAFSFLTGTVELIGEVGTDFDPFRAEGVPGLHLAYLRGSPIYHTPEDSIDGVGRSSLYHHGIYCLSLARHFGNVDLSSAPESVELVYFNVGRFWLARYPAGWGLFLAIAAAALLGVGALRRIKLGEQSVGSLIAGIGITFSGVLLAVLASTLVWLVLSRVRLDPGIAESYAYLLGLVVISVGICAALRRVVRKWRRFDEAVSVVSIWVLLALITGALVPGIAYLFGWPALAGSIALLWRPGPPSNQTRWSLALLVLVTAPSLVLLVPPIDTFFQLALPRPGNPDSDLVETIAVALLLAVLVVGLVATRWIQTETDRLERL